MKTLFVLAAVVVTLRLARPLLVLNQLLRLRVWRPVWRLADDQDVAPYAREGLRPPIAELEALGFQLVGWLLLEPGPSGDRTPRFYARLFHPDARAYARVGFSGTPDPVMPWVVTFSTLGADKRVVQTFGGGEQSVLGDPPDTISRAPYAPTLALQWEAHCQSVHAAGVTPATLGHEADFALARDRLQAHFDALVRDRCLLPDKGAEYVLAWLLALRATRATTVATARLKAQRANREKLQRASLMPPVVVPIEEEVNAYRRIVKLVTGRPRASFLALLFALTVPLFIVAGWYSTGATTLALWVLGIVLFHEFGHYLAMRALGYVDTTVFFVPFLGGVAAGRKDEATIAHRMLVLLAGPLPGLLVAIALATLVRAPVAPWLRDAVPLLAAINLFNLLPILPLDGGQIAHMLLFARHPWLDVASRAISGLALIVIGWAASGTFLLILGVLALVQLPKTRRQAEVRRLYAEAQNAWPAEPAERLFFRVLATSPLARSPFAQKVAFGRMLQSQAGVNKAVRAGALVGWLSAYGATLAVGCAALVLSFSGPARARAAPGGRTRVEGVALLACPAAGVEAAADRAAAFNAFFTGVAIFDGPEVLDAERASLKAADARTVSRAIGPALLVWSRTPRGDDESDGVDARSKRVRAAMIAAGGRFVGGPSSLLAFECVAPDAATAASIDDRLEDFVVVARGSTRIPPPWHEGEPTEAQKLARRTLRIAVTASETVPYEFSPTVWIPFWPTDYKKSLGERRAKQLRAAHAALGAQRAAGPIDEEVARIVTAQLASPEEAEDLEEPLQARLGPKWPSAQAATGVRLKASHVNSRVRVELQSPWPAQIEAEVRPMLSWLCAKSCADLHLNVETPSRSLGTDED